MRLRRTHLAQWVAASALAVVAFIACDNDVKYEVVTDCLHDAVLDTSCEGGVSYTCTSASVPSDSDPTVVCTSRHTEKSGDSVFCCAASSTLTSTCSSAPSVTCENGETGYYCSGSDSPSALDPSLECVASFNPNGGNDYCCSHESGSTAGCTDDGYAGCTSGTTGYDCPVNTTPQTVNASLTCGPPSLDSRGAATIYCCSVK